MPTHCIISAYARVFPKVTYPNIFNTKYALKTMRRLSPGHGVVLHSWYSCAGPEHVVPPYFGLGFVQVRLRLRTPELQSRLHWVHELQTDQPPFTVSPEIRPDRSTSPDTHKHTQVHTHRDGGWVSVFLCWTEDVMAQIQCWYMQYMNWCLVINIALQDWAEMSSRKIYSAWDKSSGCFNAVRVITRSQQHGERNWGKIWLLYLFFRCFYLNIH